MLDEVSGVKSEEIQWSRHRCTKQLHFQHVGGEEGLGAADKKRFLVCFKGALPVLCWELQAS